jgi:steroid delta-isomerase-like uncharacterized protein
MHPTATRRTVVAAALAAPLAIAGETLAQEATPGADEIEAIVRAFYEPFNTGDVSAYDTILAEDWVDVPLGPGQEPGREGFKPIIGIYRGIFPDLSVTNEDIVIAGNKAAVRSTIRGTHSGDLFGIPATGQPVEFMAIDIHRIENGQIVETHHIEDFLSVIFQLGATIQPGMAATPTA